MSGASVSQGGGRAATMRVTDDLGDAVDAPVEPKRIVSLVPSLSEAIAVFGAADRVVGVTRYCTRPEDAFTWAEPVGGTKTPDVAQIVELEPDLVIANAEENRPQEIIALRKAGLAVYVTFPRTVTEAAGMLRKLGRLVGATAAGEEVALDIERAVAEAYVRRPAPSLKTFCPIWRKPYMAVGTGTYADDALRLSGFVSVLGVTSSRYPKVDLDHVRELEPEVVLLPDEPYAFTSEHKSDFEGWGARIVIFDGTLLSWYGPQTAEAIRGLTDMALALEREVRR